MRKQTQQSGAQAERDSVLNYIRRRLREMKTECNADGNFPRESFMEMQELEKWILNRTARFNAKPGGLGVK